MKTFFITTCCCLSLSLSAAEVLDKQPVVTNPQEAIDRLKQGNGRYAKDETVCPDRHEERRLSLVSKQAPFAAIVGCSDSRVSPEIVFDQGSGDLFVVRVAGNVVGDVELASIDFSALVLGASVIVVLGHQNCGAVQAVMDHQTADIQAVANLISPSIANKPTLRDATIANVNNMRDKILKHAPLAKLFADKKLQVVGAYYNLESGVVEFLPQS